VNRFEIKTVTLEMFPIWKELAREVEPLFQGAMAENLELHKKIRGSILKGDVFAAVDPMSNEVAGIIIVSREKNKIAWLAVFNKYRGKGAGALLLERAIAELDATRAIEVVTFREENKEGLPARRLYQKYAFQDFDTNYYFNGYPRCLMMRSPQRQT
jgi:ribosomal protein S18 acetylase RimI-like enzyme